MNNKIWIIIGLIGLFLFISLKKEAVVGICLAMADCSTFEVDTWVYKDPSASPGAMGSCIGVVEGETPSPPYTELYNTCIIPRTYSTFLSYKDSYLSGGSFSQFISDANKWVM